MPGDTDGPVCWVCQFDCEDHPEQPLLSTGCACCRAGSSGGWAHVSCLASAAAHQPKLWVECPTCKREFTGAVDMELCRWELCRNRPEADEERLVALADLAAALENSGDLAAARPLLEEQVGVARRTRGHGDQLTLMTIARLGGIATNMGEAVEARPLLEEACQVHLDRESWLENLQGWRQHGGGRTARGGDCVCLAGARARTPDHAARGWPFGGDTAGRGSGSVPSERSSAWPPSRSSTANRHSWSALTWPRDGTACATMATYG
jgi:hypothetical protein